MPATTVTMPKQVADMRMDMLIVREIVMYLLNDKPDASETILNNLKPKLFEHLGQYKNMSDQSFLKEWDLFKVRAEDFGLRPQ